MHLISDAENTNGLASPQQEAYTGCQCPHTRRHTQISKHRAHDVQKQEGCVLITRCEGVFLSQKTEDPIKDERTSLIMKDKMQKEPRILYSALNYTVDPTGVKAVPGGL